MCDTHGVSNFFTKANIFYFTLQTQGYVMLRWIFRTRDLIVWFFLSSLFFCSIPCWSSPENCVVLLHGLSRTHFSMMGLEQLLTKNHYLVVNHTYPSTKKSVQTLADEVIPALLKDCGQAKHINFVTHSIGGIILQAYLARNTIPHLEHVVMLGPPNHGSPFVDKLYKNPLIQAVLGPSFSELTTRRVAVPLLQGPYKIGVIAGNQHFNPFNWFVFDEQNDGKVSVSSTKLAGMQDFIILPVTHTFMMQNALVEKQVLHFLNQGAFNHV